MSHNVRPQKTFRIFATMTETSYNAITLKNLWEWKLTKFWWINDFHVNFYNIHTTHTSTRKTFYKPNFYGLCAYERAHVFSMCEKDRVHYVQLEFFTHVENEMLKMYASIRDMYTPFGELISKSSLMKFIHICVLFALGGWVNCNRCSLFVWHNMINISI